MISNCKGLFNERWCTTKAEHHRKNIWVASCKTVLCSAYCLLVNTFFWTALLVNTRHRKSTENLLQHSANIYFALNIVIYVIILIRYILHTHAHMYIHHIHPPVTIISKNLHFRFIQLMMYMVFIINHAHHLMNESNMLIFAYNSDGRVYMLSIIYYYYININIL